MSIRILTSDRDVAPYVESARLASDQHKAALGFLPATVFTDYAHRGKLWIAAEASGKYLGHLLFDRRFPKVTIIQMYCEEAARRRGVATALLSLLKESSTHDGFLAIKASVAEDLSQSNEFWESQGFYIQASRPGGATTGRRILIRIHELDAPQLFARSGLAIYGGDSLGLSAIASAAPPMYLIDLNIIFDLIKRRPQHSAASKLFRAAHSGEFRLAISEEMRVELAREATNPATDPMLCLIDSLPTVHIPKSDEVARVLERASRLIFPEKRYPDNLSKNDLSDLRHVVTAITCGLSGFITRDARILRAAATLSVSYGIEVFSPTDFEAADILEEPNVSVDMDSAARIELSPYADTHYESLRALLLMHAVPPDDIVSSWMPRGGDEASRIVATVECQVVAYIAWSRVEPRAKFVTVRAVLDERSPHAEKVANSLLARVREGHARAGGFRLQLITPERQSVLRQCASLDGFRATDRRDHFAKIAAGKVVTEKSWSGFREELLSLSGVTLPSDPPSWEAHSQQVVLACPDSQRRYVRLDALELLLSPALFALKGRPAVIIPVRPQYADLLLGHSRQQSLAPRMELEASRERMYLSDPRCLALYRKGDLALFYESGIKGEKAIVALARIVDSYIIGADEVSGQVLVRSVLRSNTLGQIGLAKSKAACIFDNVICLDKPVRLAELRGMGIRHARLVTTSKITNEQLETILAKGF